VSNDPTFRDRPSDPPARAATLSPRFIQLAYGQSSVGRPPRLFALDDKGQVWELHEQNSAGGVTADHWRPLSMIRTDDQGRVITFGEPPS
jgi:hypothetical protein